MNENRIERETENRILAVNTTETISSNANSVESAEWTSISTSPYLYATDVLEQSTNTVETQSLKKSVKTSHKFTEIAETALSFNDELIDLPFIRNGRVNQFLFCNDSFNYGNNTSFATTSTFTTAVPNASTMPSNHILRNLYEHVSGFSNNSKMANRTGTQNFATSSPDSFTWAVNDENQSKTAWRYYTYINYLQGHTPDNSLTTKASSVLYRYLVSTPVLSNQSKTLIDATSSPNSSRFTSNDINQSNNNWNLYRNRTDESCLYGNIASINGITNTENTSLNLVQNNNSITYTNSSQGSMTREILENNTLSYIKLYDQTWYKKDDCYLQSTSTDTPTSTNNFPPSNGNISNTLSPAALQDSKIKTGIQTVSDGTWHNLNASTSTNSDDAPESFYENQIYIDSNTNISSTSNSVTKHKPKLIENILALDDDDASKAMKKNWKLWQTEDIEQLSFKELKRLIYILFYRLSRNICLKTVKLLCLILENIRNFETLLTDLWIEHLVAAIKTLAPVRWVKSIPDVMQYFLKSYINNVSDSQLQHLIDALEYRYNCRMTFNNSRLRIKFAIVDCAECIRSIMVKQTNRNFECRIPEKIMDLN